ncbi:hypothetical protein L1887_57573 [Cichorium endivia]|nr:hypothetical protein L1887_57573 [Cichorium endivia]
MGASSLGSRMVTASGRGRGMGLGHASTSLGVPALHDLDLDAENTLLHQHVADGLVNEVLDGLTGVDHETVGELHRLGTGSTQLTRDDDLATLGARLHDEAEHTVGGTADSETAEQLVAERLALGNGVETAVLHLLGVGAGTRIAGTDARAGYEASGLADSAGTTNAVIQAFGVDDCWASSQFVLV